MGKILGLSVPLIYLLPLSLLCAQSSDRNGFSRLYFRPFNGLSIIKGVPREQRTHSIQMRFEVF
ncbi:hypothetical protein CY34DRAFT_804183 [Suillus luteus UH-Slu-Lm8-n1]|uniref:Uncharacterized protein n=1 Tax=Suillus luteus UH-Slu-Lm8-n1 TaxID=930992 RepID=A0A0C9ZZP0_9AGAM|nr:hypothetical protein CY34DRAFT_804183 [Suillus luteus UH-Slu-Lm8-n1]